MIPAPHVIVFLTYEGFELLDVTGPVAVFSAANDVLRRRHYDVRLVSARGGLVASSSGVAVATRALARMPHGRVHTLLVAGAEESPLRRVIADPAVRRWVPRCAARAARFGSVCSGAFVLAALGLLDKKRVATHWRACDLLASMFPAAAVNRDALFVTDGKLWTSAGVTTGIDMSLAMVEHDVGARVANLVARGLVLYARRPGYQSQFSPLLHAQVQADSPFAE